jgi:hypothetical protein
MAVVMGHLPPGLSIDQTSGAITGVALKAGIWYPTIRVIDAAGKRARRKFSLTVKRATAAYCERTLLCQEPKTNFLLASARIGS